MKIARVPAANAKFELVDVKIPEPGHGHVRVKVHACGVCNSDSLTVVGGFGQLLPRTPGHEVAGLVDAVGDGVSNWSVGRPRRGRLVRRLRFHVRSVSSRGFHLM